MNNEQKNMLKEILDRLAENLDITDTEYNEILHSYEAVGKHLSKAGCILEKYEVEIKPQGSFNLGTIIRPIKEGDDLDIDLVCELRAKPANWTQFDLKNMVGQRLQESDLYQRLLDEEGRRCWTLKYRSSQQSTKNQYHMDILPCIVANNYKEILNEMYSARELTQADYDKASIRITDKKSEGYYTETDITKWLKSNPFGYAKWFKLRQEQGILETRMFGSSIQLPEKRGKKSILQKVVQLLKRHRDIYYAGDDDKPISIIITTLAARAYSGEQDIVSAFVNIAKNMRKQIVYRGNRCFIYNPVNPLENFADKWVEQNRKQEVFFEWLTKVEKLVEHFNGDTDKIELQQQIIESFGREVSTKTFSDISNKMKVQIKTGTIGVGTTGIISASGKEKIQKHNFYGNENEE